MRNPILTTLITPPLVFGVTASSLFMTLILLFVSIVILRDALGISFMLFGIILAIGFYYYSKKRSKTNPYWFNSFLISARFELKKVHSLIYRLFTKKDKILYR